MNIKDVFLELTDKTYPYGTESEVVAIIESILNIKLDCDDFGNYYYKVDESRTIFSSHLDSACLNKSKVNHIIEGDIIKTDGRTILGADDKAGVTVMLNMMEKGIPGLYYFFIGEENGCIGSKKLAKGNPYISDSFDRMISFDRRLYGSVITEQVYGVCCSKSFAFSLCDQLTRNGIPSIPDPTGIYTDSAMFTNIIPEVTNISVGYGNEHENNEFQNLNYLKKLCRAVLKVNWESLPTRALERSSN